MAGFTHRNAAKHVAFELKSGAETLVILNWPQTSCKLAEVVCLFNVFVTPL